MHIEHVTWGVELSVVSMVGLSQPYVVILCASRHAQGIGQRQRRLQPLAGEQGTLTCYLHGEEEIWVLPVLLCKACEKLLVLMVMHELLTVSLI